MPGWSGPPSNGRTRSGFALTGPSVLLDPRTHAVRPDLADIRLAGRVFAPHFAVAIACRAVQGAEVRLARQGDPVVTLLAPGDRFDVLEMSGGLAWGIATGPGLVGYVACDALENDPEHQA